MSSSTLIAPARSLAVTAAAAAAAAAAQDAVERAADGRAQHARVNHTHTPAP